MFGCWSSRRTSTCWERIRFDLRPLSMLRLFFVRQVCYVGRPARIADGEAKHGESAELFALSLSALSPDPKSAKSPKQRMCDAAGNHETTISLFVVTLWCGRSAKYPGRRICNTRRVVQPFASWGRQATPTATNKERKREYLLLALTSRKSPSLLEVLIMNFRTRLIANTDDSPSTAAVPLKTLTRVKTLTGPSCRSTSPRLKTRKKSGKGRRKARKVVRRMRSLSSRNAMFRQSAWG